MDDQMMASFNEMENIREGEVIGFGGCQYKKILFWYNKLKDKLNKNKPNK